MVFVHEVCLFVVNYVSYKTISNIIIYIAIFFEVFLSLALILNQGDSCNSVAHYVENVDGIPIKNVPGQNYQIADFETGVVAGLVLHEENIGLLLESHQQLKDMAASRRLKTGTNCLVGEQFSSRGDGVAQLVERRFRDPKTSWRT